MFTNRTERDGNAMVRMHFKITQEDHLILLKRAGAVLERRVADIVVVVVTSNQRSRFISTMVTALRCDNKIRHELNLLRSDSDLWEDILLTDIRALSA